MVDGIGSSNGAVGRAAVDAALERLRARAKELSGQGPGDAATPKPSFAQAVGRGLLDVDAAVRAGDRLPADVIEGRLDFHEVTARLKQSELSFEFAMQVRNKFIEAYREVMRMNV